MTDPRDEGVHPTVTTQAANDGPGGEVVQPNPADTAQEAVHQVMLREDVPSEQIAAVQVSAEVVQPESTDVTRRSSPRSIAPRPAWIQEIDAACRTWPSLERADLLRTLGRPHLLSSLVQRAEGLERDVADGRVARFFASLDEPTTDSRP